MLDFVKEFWMFAKRSKKLWLAPIVILLILLGLLMVATSGSVIAPFVYTLF